MEKNAESKKTAGFSQVNVAPQTPEQAQQFVATLKAQGIECAGDAQGNVFAEDSKLQEAQSLLAQGAKKTVADYQGYKNYETWTVSLLLDNDQGSQEMVREWAQEAVAGAAGASQVKDGIWNVSEAAKFALADRIKGHIEDNNPLSGKGDVYEQLLGAAISEVDWVEVAENFLEGVEPESVKEGSLMAAIDNMGKVGAKRYTAQELYEMPTIERGQFSNLKVQTPTERVWLSRMTKADGAEHNNAVEIEQLVDGAWKLVEDYDGGAIAGIETESSLVEAIDKMGKTE